MTWWQVPLVCSGFSTGGRIKVWRQAAGGRRQAKPIAENMSPQAMYRLLHGKMKQLVKESGQAERPKAEPATSASGEM
jgi:hypothetical protein